MFLLGRNMQLAVNKTLIYSKLQLCLQLVLSVNCHDRSLFISQNRHWKCQFISCFVQLLCELWRTVHSAQCTGSVRVHISAAYWFLKTWATAGGGGGGRQPTNFNVCDNTSTLYRVVYMRINSFAVRLWISSVSWMWRRAVWWAGGNTNFPNERGLFLW